MSTTPNQVPCRFACRLDGTTSEFTLKADDEQHARQIIAVVHGTEAANHAHLETTKEIEK